MRRVAPAAALGLALGGMVGCKHHSPSEKYVLVTAETTLPYWKAARDGFSQAAQVYGVSATTTGPEHYDPAAEQAALEQAIAAKPAGILVSVVDAQRLRPIIDRAIQAGIPVLTIDSDAPDSARPFFIGTNNFEAGHLGAQRLASLLHGKGKVAFFTEPSQPNLAERLKGYTDGLTRSPGIKVAEVFDLHGDPDTAFDKTREYLARTGADRIDAFVALDSVSGKVISDAMARQNISDRTIIAMDTTADVLNLIQSGAIQATISQKPYTMGYVGLTQLIRLHADGGVKAASHAGANVRSQYPVFIDTGTAVVDKENLAGFLNDVDGSK